MNTLIKALFVAMACFAHAALAVGLLPIPVLKDVQIRAETRLDASRGWYYYAYAVNNPAQSTGEIWDIKIDILNPYNTRLEATGLTIAIGNKRSSFQGELDALRRIATPQNFIPVGQNVPPGWHGGLGREGVASFSSGNDAINILPGTGLDGFELYSPGLPTIRNVQLIPWWVFLVDDHENVTLAERQTAGQSELDMIYRTVTLGPSGVERGNFAHWNLLRDDLARAIQLGWFPDAGLASALTTQLAAAREALETRDLYLTHQRLNVLLATIAAATPTQRTSEGYGLMYFNVKAIIESTTRPSRRAKGSAPAM